MFIDQSPVPNNLSATPLQNISDGAVTDLIDMRPGSFMFDPDIWHESHFDLNFQLDGLNESMDPRDVR